MQYRAILLLIILFLFVLHLYTEKIPLLTSAARICPSSQIIPSQTSLLVGYGR